MAIFRGTTGTGSSDNTIVSAVTEQAGIATTKADEAEGFRDEAEGFKNTASTAATTATTKASNASDSADTASDKATEANTAKGLAEDAQTAAENARDAALGHANTANSSAVQTVAGSNTQVVGVYNNIANVNTVAGVNTDVTTVAGISSDVTTVAADASDIGTVSTNIANVNNVGNNIANVNAVHGNASNINTVAADGTDIGTVATNIANVNTVAGISSTVTTVAGLESKMDTVIADASDIGAVAGNIGDVTTVAGINSDVDTVAGIAAKVTTVADNITDVQNADTNATNAASSASDASASATSASNSATTATTKATEASNSATAASNSATTATTKASQAAGSATTAGTSASTATTKASEASASATTATTKAGEAASSASAASGSATTATTKAAEADASAVSAASSATNSSNAASTWNNFYNSYLGTADAPPSVDVLGNAIVAGALYYDTGAGSNTVGLYVYNGSSWVYSTNYNNVTAPYSLSQDLATNSHDINFGDNAKAKFGAGNDLQIYHDTGNSVIADKGTGDLYLQGSNTIRLTNDDATEHYAKFNHNGGVELRHDNNIKFNTTATGIDVTGNVSLADNGKATFGASDDLQIYHDGSNSYIRDDGTGELRLNSDNAVRIRKHDNETLALFSVDGSATLYHNNSPKIATTSTGIDVTGTVTADGFQTDTSNTNYNLLARNSSNVAAYIQNGGTGDVLQARSGNMAAGQGDLHLKVANNGDISFYEDTGTTPKFFWDASTERLGIGTSSPTAPLHVKSATDAIFRLESSDSNSWNYMEFQGNTARQGWIGSDNNNAIQINADNASKILLSGGNVGIGTTSPNSLLETSGTSSGGEVEGLRLTNNSTTTNSSSSIIFNLSTASIDSAKIAAIRTNSPTSSDTELAFSQLRNGTLTERLRIASDGNVGIGTDNPTALLDVVGESGSISNITVSNPDVGLRMSAYTDQHAEIRVETNHPLLFKTNGNNERMRIDSSGNLLVGKTTYGVNTQGFGAYSSGAIEVNAGDATAAYFNRTTGDGELLNFRKDGLPVGTIGTTGGDMYVGTGDTGIRFDDATNHIRPCGVSGANLDAAIDIGDSSRRFKDLHLSGTINKSAGLGTFKIETSGSSSVNLEASNTLKFTVGDSDSHQFINGSSEVARIDSSGNLLVNTTTSSTNVKLKVSGASKLDDTTIYNKVYSGIDTTGNIVAKTGGGANGSSTTFVFTGQGGNGQPFHILFACKNSSGTWSATRAEVLASPSVDVVSAQDGDHITFTFKSKSGTQAFSPRVKVEIIGSNFDSQYLI